MSGAVWRSLGTLYAGFSNTTTPSPPVAAVGGWEPAPYTGFLSMRISSKEGSPVKRFSGVMFAATWL